MTLNEDAYRLLRERAEEIAQLTREKDEFRQLYLGALRNVQVSVKHAERLNVQLDWVKKRLKELTV